MLSPDLVHEIKAPRLLLEPGRFGPFIDAVISGLNDYTHWRPVPMDTGWTTTTTRAGRVAFCASHFNRHLNIRVIVHVSLSSNIAIRTLQRYRRRAGLSTRQAGDESGQRSVTPPDIDTVIGND